MPPEGPRDGRRGPGRRRRDPLAAARAATSRCSPPTWTAGPAPSTWSTPDRRRIVPAGRGRRLRRRRASRCASDDGIDVLVPDRRRRAAPARRRARRAAGRRHDPRGAAAATLETSPGQVRARPRAATDDAACRETELLGTRGGARTGLPGHRQAAPRRRLARACGSSAIAGRARRGARRRPGPDRPGVPARATEYSVDVLADAEGHVIAAVPRARARGSTPASRSPA